MTPTFFLFICIALVSASWPLAKRSLADLESASWPLAKRSLADLESDESSGIVSLYSRMLVISNDENLGANYTPPTLAQLIASVLDVNHSLAVSSGLYTQTQIDTLRNDSFNFFLTQFNIDFASGTLLSDGKIIAPSFLMVPYKSGFAVPIHVSFDSENINRGATTDWYGFQFGEVVAATASGAFSSGAHAGETYVAGDVLAYFDYNLIKSEGGTPTSAQPREIVRFRLPWTSKTILNSQNYTDTLSKMEGVDSNNNVGFALESIMLIRDPSTGVTYKKTRVTVTWD